MRYGSVCSGIEAATAAWDPLGWQPQFFAEIDSFPSAVLQHHYPNVPNMGDFTNIGSEHAIDLLVGGTPCQSFSVAGLRGGLADERGNLALEFLRLADRLRPRWLVWENVPGVYSATSDDAPDHSGDGDGRWSDDATETHAFACFVAGLQELGYGFAYRTLDAQFFGVPQRRRRVFVVGHLGDWRRAAAVLFERHSLSGHPAPRRQKGQIVAQPLANGSGERRWKISADNAATHLIPSTGDIAHCLNAGGMGRQDYETETLIAHSLRGDGFDASEDGTGRGTPLIAVALRMPDGCEGGGKGALLSPELSLTLATGNDQTIFQPVAHMTMAFHSRQEPIHLRECSLPLEAKGGQSLQQGMAVRRLTPKECERLQGFPDDYTAIPYKGKLAADGPRYKALGNSMAVPCMKWIGERIQMVEALP